MQPERTTNSELKTEIASILIGILDGHSESIGRWFAIAERPIAGIVHTAIRETGIYVDSERRHDIIQDAILEVGVLSSRSWQPDGGAMPWNWANSRIRSITFNGIGFLSDHLDELNEPPAATPDGTPTPDHRAGRDVLEELIDRPAARLLAGVLDRRVSKRNQNIWLEVEMEKQIGNRSPATTVAKTHGLKPDNVRQIYSRVSRALKAEAALDHKLAEVHILAA